jgi:hypothetical protein
MNDDLHPMNLSEVLDRTVQIYRSRFLVFLGIGVIPAGTVLVFASAFFAFLAWIGSAAKSSSVPALVIAWLLFALGSLLALPACLGTTALGSAAMSSAAARLFLGETITIREAYKRVWLRGWRYVGLYVLEVLIVAGVPAVVGSVLLIFASIASALLVSQLGATASILLGGAMFFVIVLLASYALWMMLRLCLAFPAIVVEQTGASNALKRASLLSKGTRGRIFVLYLLCLVLSWVLAIGLAVPAFIALALIPGLQGPQHSETLGMAMMFVSYGSSFAVQAFTKPIYGIAMTLFYFDQRIRKEGFDIEWMMHRAGMVPPSQPKPEALPWLPPMTTGEQSASLHDDAPYSPHAANIVGGAAAADDALAPPEAMANGREAEGA